MSAATDAMTRELRARIVPPAQSQTALAPQDLLHSANAGVVVSKVGQVRSEFRNQARIFAREMAKHVNTRQAGNATAFVYEETFGTEDRLHFLIHLASLASYYRLVEMGDQDRAYRESLAVDRVHTADGASAWDRLFVDGTLRSTVLLPASWDRSRSAVGAVQTAQPDGVILHSGNAGIVIHRVAQIRYGARARALAFARESAAAVNEHLAGEATALVYDEAFGARDRVHWLLHLQDLTSYDRLLDLDLDLPDAGGLFVEASMRDTALTPHHWGLYGTGEA